MSQYLQQICVPLRSHGFTDVNVDEIVRSIRCLAKHGILTLDTNITKPAKSPPPAIWNQDSSVPGKSYFHFYPILKLIRAAKANFSQARPNILPQFF